jgi:hypothetical protein
MSFHRITLDPAIGPPAYWIRKVSNWLTCRITDRPSTSKVIRRSAFLARYRSVIKEAACQRNFVTNPVFIPVIRNNRKSGLGTPVTFSNNPFFPQASEKNAIGRIREALAICNTCPMLEECRNLTEDSNAPVAHGFVQAGIVFVDKVTDMRKAIAKWNATHPRALRIPTKGRGAWNLRKVLTPKQYEEYITDLTTTTDFRAATLQIEIDRPLLPPTAADAIRNDLNAMDDSDAYKTEEAWAEVIELFG